MTGKKVRTANPIGKETSDKIADLCRRGLSRKGPPLTAAENRSVYMSALVQHQAGLNPRKLRSWLRQIQAGIETDDVDMALKAWDAVNAMLFPPKAAT